MSNITLIVLGLLITFIFALYLLYQYTAAKLSASEMKNNEYEHTIRQLKDENSILRDEMKITAKNRREANEKINALHSGELSADDILPK